jgi:hypothetical protein
MAESEVDQALHRPSDRKVIASTKRDVGCGIGRNDLAGEKLGANPPDALFRIAHEQISEGVPIDDRRGDQSGPTPHLSDDLLDRRHLGISSALISGLHNPE